MKQYKDTDYDIYEDGRCFSHKTNRFMKPNMNKKYPTYNITFSDGNKKTVAIHRMVAETFLSNPNNLPQVNHIDGDTRNYNANNLEWVSAADNSKHAAEMGLRPKGNQNAIFYTDDLDGEEWKPIAGYRNYLVSNCGRVMNKDTKRLLRASISGNGYPYVCLYQNNKGTTTQIHQLVYSTFYNDQALEGFVINHKDGNKTNNNATNLEKITRSENNLHAEYVIKTHSSSRKIAQIDMEGNVIAEFVSIAEAKRITKINNIQRAAANKLTAGGYYWNYIDK